MYASDPTTDIWCLAWAIDDAVPSLWVPGDPPPLALVEHVLAGHEMRAHNAQFERVIWREILGPRYGFPVPALEQWHCTAAEAAAMALPRSLGEVSAVLPKLPVMKDLEGRRIMLQLSRPRRMEGDTPVWWDDPEKLNHLYRYCVQDVEAERAVASRLRRLSRLERHVYLLDQKVNDRGVFVDRRLVEAAAGIVETGLQRANDELDTLTQGAVGAVTRVGQLTDWLRDTGLDLPDLSKATVRDLLAEGGLTPVQRQVLQIRADAGKSSTAKLKAMLSVLGADDRARGLLMYHGASTGRWSGRLIQPQNFPRGTVDDVESYIPQVLDGAFDDMVLLGENPLEVVSSMLRSMLRAAPGHRLMAGDYSQVEARVLGWLAGEPYGDKEYERMAAAIYGVPLADVTKDQRQIGKNTVLGAGFQMGPLRFQEQIGEQAGVEIPDELAERAISVFRSTKPGIPRFWAEIENAAMGAVREKGKTTYAGVDANLRFAYRAGFLWCILPSGRALAYAAPQLKMRTRIWTDKEGNETGRTTKLGLQYLSVNSVTRKWSVVHAYGGLLTENVVQATARDLMAAAMLRLERAKYPVIMTVHDEVVCEVPDGFGSVEEFNRIMEILPPWARGCPVKAESWEGERYRK